VDFPTAVQMGLVSGSVWRYDVANHRYVPIGLRDFLPAGQGFWVMALRNNVQLIWPSP